MAKAMDKNTVTKDDRLFQKKLENYRYIFVLYPSFKEILIEAHTKETLEEKYKYVIEEIGLNKSSFCKEYAISVFLEASEKKLIKYQFASQNDLSNNWIFFEHLKSLDAQVRSDMQTAVDDFFRYKVKGKYYGLPIFYIGEFISYVVLILNDDIDINP